MNVVDSTFLIDYYRQPEPVGAYLAAYDDETLIAPTIVFQEVAVGEILAHGESKEAILSDLGWLDIRPFDSQHAYHAAVIEADLRDRGTYDPVHRSDILIGGVARALSVPVLTRNTDHFTSLDDVATETY
jgi:predicted nucleic acid-binding protein